MKQFRDTPYYVTEDGIIRNGKLLSKHLSNKGYYVVGMWLNGKSIKFNLHRIIAETYIPNPENKSQVNHINGDKLDNRIENLEWVTNQENRNHAVQNKLHAQGEQIGNSKFTEDDIKWIRENYIPHHPQYGMSAMARKLNTYPSTIHKIIHRTRWNHI
jgi:hypothetical protein